MGLEYMDAIAMIVWKQTRNNCESASSQIGSRWLQHRTHPIRGRAFFFNCDIALIRLEYMGTIAMIVWKQTRNNCESASSQIGSRWLQHRTYPNRGRAKHKMATWPTFDALYGTLTIAALIAANFLHASHSMLSCHPLFIVTASRAADASLGSAPSETRAVLMHDPPSIDPLCS